jgi:hypothetical protein
MSLVCESSVLMIFWKPHGTVVLEDLSTHCSRKRLDASGEYVDHCDNCCGVSRASFYGEG